jgi:membrane-associated protein
MHEILNSIKDILNPQWIIDHGGIWFLLFTIFAETGLFLGFFLPGDSLLFVAGIYSNPLAADFLKTFGSSPLHNGVFNLLLLIILIVIAGFVGNLVGFAFGKKIGPTMFNWKDRFLFKKKYLHDAHEFYEKHGGGAVVFARFLPIIRTFAPIVAGIVNMDKRKFTLFNLFGCIAWVTSMLVGGHFLEKIILEQFNFDLRKHLEVIVIGIIFVTTAPVLWKLFFGKDKSKTE